MENISSSIFLKLLLSLDNYTYGLFAPLMVSFRGFLFTITVLWLVLMGYLVAKGTFKEATGNVITSLGLVFILSCLVFDPQIYFKWVADPFKFLVFDLSTFLISYGSETKNYGDIFRNLDAAFGKLVTAMDQIMPKDNFITNAGLYIKAAAALTLLGLAFAAAYFAFFFLFAMSIFALHVLFIVGGICIIFASFPQTRHITWQWLRTLINYGLTAIFASLIMSMFLSGINTAIDDLARIAQTTNEIFTTEYATALVWAALAFGMLLKAPDLAASLSGGTAGSSAGITAGLSLVSTSILKGIKTGAGPAGRLGGSLADRGLSNLPGGAGRAYSYMKGIYKGEGK
ncbi:MAG: type IV secretion system protein [Proteobacteria bacterium]|nr:type IV secretion system protein [Pseudomonadota bacterium]MBU1547780.1 type IV secretion system protein [Pseudomonadota bacterium]MBU2619699.1 type IV secretion system protein [Pseudomonadota bacterium]